MRKLAGGRVVRLDQQDREAPPGGVPGATCSTDAAADNDGIKGLLDIRHGMPSIAESIHQCAISGEVGMRTIEIADIAEVSHHMTVFAESK